MKSGHSKTQPQPKKTSSHGDAVALVELLRNLRAEGHMVLSATVGGCHVDLGPSYSNTSNVSTPRTTSVVEEYGGAAIAKLQNELDGDDEDVPAVRS